jgi:DNA invertase Pin-like site-specific DNA recombinase
MKLAKERGRLKGKQPKLSDLQVAHLGTLHDAGDHTVSELMDLFGVGRGTIYRSLERRTDKRVSSTP